MNKLLLIGTGPMSEAYMQVLQSFDLNVQVIGRGEKSANQFKANTNVMPVIGGLEKFLEENKLEEKTKAIIATGTENLMQSLKLLISAGIDSVLIEKPAAISIEELVENEDFLKDHLNKIFIAYNRRYYASVREVMKLIEEDGGLKTMHFEFTEWAHRIQDLEKAPGVKENWFFANSTHVVDSAFFIAGFPKNLCCFSEGGNIDWHEKTNFTGAGKTNKNVLFSYASNWESAGRWAIELMTNKRRIYLKPLEEVKIQVKGSVEIVNHEFDDSLDKKFKPGLYLQVESFVNNNFNELLDMEQHLINSKEIYSKILTDSN